MSSLPTVRPSGTSDPCPARLERARAILASADQTIRRFTYGALVTSQSDPTRAYWVTPHNGVYVCNCPDHYRLNDGSLVRDRECKHGLAMRLLAEQERGETDAEQARPSTYDTQWWLDDEAWALEQERNYEAAMEYGGAA